MTSEDVILEQIKNLNTTIAQQWKSTEKQGRDIAEIKETVSLIAVQSNRIDRLAEDVSELRQSRKENDSKIGEIERFQASCPREIVKEAHDDLKEEMRSTMKRQWAIIALLATVVIGMLIKGV